MASIEVSFGVLCDVCGDELDHEMDTWRGSQRVRVTPCQSCLERAEEGRNKQKDLGEIM